MNIEERTCRFRDLLSRQSVQDVVQSEITTGTCVAIGDEQYTTLRRRVAKHFGVHRNEVIVVGSAKLGFSIAPDKRYRAFGDQSDIDVAVCSSEVFDSLWLSVFEFWHRGETWPGLSQFRKYLFRGWMRPDLLPPGGSFRNADIWWEFFRELTATGECGNYKIAGALYKSWRYLEAYQEKCVTDCHLELETTNEDDRD